MSSIYVTLNLGDTDIELDLDEIAENLDIDSKVENEVCRMIETEVLDSLRDHAIEVLADNGITPDTNDRLCALEAFEEKMLSLAPDSLQPAIPENEEALEKLAEKLAPYLIKTIMSRLLSVG